MFWKEMVMSERLLRLGGKITNVLIETNSQNFLGQINDRVGESGDKWSKTDLIQMRMTEPLSHWNIKAGYATS